MANFKHESKAAPTAWSRTALSLVLRADSISGHATVYHDNDEGDTYGKDIALADLPQDQQDCITALRDLMGGAVEAEGYEKDPHTRRKQEEADRKAAEKAAKDAEKAEAEPEIPAVG